MGPPSWAEDRLVCHPAPACWDVPPPVGGDWQLGLNITHDRTTVSHPLLTWATHPQPLLHPLFLCLRLYGARSTAQLLRLRSQPHSDCLNTVNVSAIVNASERQQLILNQMGVTDIFSSPCLWSVSKLPGSLCPEHIAWTLSNMRAVIPSSRHHDISTGLPKIPQLTFKMMVCYEFLYFCGTYEAFWFYRHTIA